MTQLSISLMRPLLPLLLGLGLLGTAAAKAETINVLADQARIMPLPGDPATLFIGNPMIADVTIQNGVMAIHGRQFGTTNLIILDHDGKQVASYEINVQNGGGQMVQVFKAGTRLSYNCQPICEAIAVPGDDPGHMSNVLSQISSKTAAALNSANQATDLSAATPPVAVSNNMGVAASALAAVKP